MEKKWNRSENQHSLSNDDVKAKTACHSPKIMKKQKTGCCYFFKNNIIVISHEINQISILDKLESLKTYYINNSFFL